MDLDPRIQIVCNAHNELFRRAANSGDLFRQWFYPDLPSDYKVRDGIIRTITIGADKGKTASEIVAEIIWQYEQDDKRCPESGQEAE